MLLTILTNLSSILLHAGHSHEPTTFALWAGIAAAVLHVISGPDHLAAVTPLAVEAKRKVWKIGFTWGSGHLLGMLLIGLLFYFFKEVLPLEAVSAYSEQLVAIVLISVGLWALYSVFGKKKKVHSHPHIHDGDEPYLHVHKHDHVENGKAHTHHHQKSEKRNLWASFGIGVIHGLAGIAHFFLLLPVLGFEKGTDSFEYILGFGFGTVVAMTVYTFILGLISRRSKKQGSQLTYKVIRLAGGLFALLVGFYWLYLAV
ncbi:MAG: sulfite exporter TauE/SafE family protein [Bacteroidota bacterium]